MRASFRVWLLGGLFAVISCLVFGAAISHSRANRPLNIDIAWMVFLREHRSPIALAVSQFLAEFGGGIIGGAVVPLAVMAAFGLARRPWAAVFFGVTTVVSAESVVLLKLLFDRPRPGHLVLGDIVGSFPSGHAANAATLVVLMGFLLRRRWVVAVGTLYLPVMMISRTYLGVHWLSDTIGGALVGLGIPMFIFGLAAPVLEKEQERERNRAQARGSGDRQQSRGSADRQQASLPD